MSRVLLILIIGLGLSCVVCAQETFIRSYHTNGSETAYNMMVKEDFILLVGEAECEHRPAFCGAIVMVNRKDYDTILTEVIYTGTPNTNIGSGNAYVLDSYYLYLSSYTTIDSQNHLEFIKYDLFGKNVVTNTLIPHGNDILTRLHVTGLFFYNDRVFALINAFRVDGSWALWTFDQDLNLIEQKDFHTDLGPNGFSNDSYRPFMRDNRIIMPFDYDTNDSENPFRDIYVRVEIDLDANILDRDTLAFLEDDLDWSRGYYENDDYRLYFEFDWLELDAPGWPISVSSRKLIKSSHEDSIYWESELSRGVERQTVKIWDLDVDERGQIFGVGMTEKNPFDDIPETISLYKWSPNGELLWERLYWIRYTEAFDVSARPFLLNVHAEDDGHILMSGRITDTFPLNQEIDNNNMLLMRVDSMGCLEPGCDLQDTVLIVSSEEIEQIDLGLGNASAFRVYPNPASDRVQIEGPQSGLRMEYAQLINAQGKVLRRTKSSIMDVSGLARGIYFVRIVTRQGEFYEKLIVGG